MPHSCLTLQYNVYYTVNCNILIQAMAGTYSCIKVQGLKNNCQLNMYIDCCNDEITNEFLE